MSIISGRFETFDENNRIYKYKQIIDLCLQNEHYYVAIVSPSMRWRHLCVQDIIGYLHEHSVSNYKCYTNGRIYLANGSTITILTGSEEHRGRRFHYFLVNNKVNIDYLNKVIKPQLIEYKMNPTRL